MPDEVGVQHALVHEPGGGDSIVRSLIESVSSVHDVAPTDLPPLQGTLDADALIALLDTNGQHDAGPTIEFEYANCRVTVDSGGLIQVRSMRRLG